MEKPTELDLLREAQECLYAAITALAEGDQRTVARQTFKAQGLLAQVNRAAVLASGGHRRS